jgi:aminoglycoside N3'-acetyltransferase
MSGPAVDSLSSARLKADFQRLGIVRGDTVLVRAGLRAVGEIDGGARGFVEALVGTVGPEGTVMSLAFTDSAYIRRADPNAAFTVRTKSNAGALPNAMLADPSHSRSKHPTCSYVAIGRHALDLTAGHDESSGAYEPIRRLMQFSGKCVLVGCVDSSPGFTTAHLAECDLGLHRRAIFPWLTSTYYKSENGELKLFRRKDLGLCSQSFYKFYAHYVRNGILVTGLVGGAYSILAPAADCYEIERRVLARDPQFNVCDSPRCFTCNAGRWDRLHRLPSYIFRLASARFAGRRSGPGS